MLERTGPYFIAYARSPVIDSPVSASHSSLAPFNLPFHLEFENRIWLRHHDDPGTMMRGRADHGKPRAALRQSSIRPMSEGGRLPRMRGMSL